MATGFGTWTEGLLKKVKKQSDPTSASEPAATSQPTTASPPVQQPVLTPQQTTTTDPTNSSRVTFRNPFKKRQSDPNPTGGIQNPTTFEPPVQRPASMPQQTASNPDAQNIATTSQSSTIPIEPHQGRPTLDRYYTEHSYAFPPTKKMVERYLITSLPT